jgi:hypothetical protein
VGFSKEEGDHYGIDDIGIGHNLNRLLCRQRLCMFIRCVTFRSEELAAIRSAFDFELPSSKICSRKARVSWSATAGMSYKEWLAVVSVL